MKNQDVIKYITGRNCGTFTCLNEAKQYADKWKSKTISVYKNGLYHSTIHKVNDKWND